jgi:hypothetical protein
LTQPRLRNSSKSTRSAFSAQRASVSSLSTKHASVKPQCLARSRKICVFGRAWPSGAIAGSLISA